MVDKEQTILELRETVEILEVGGSAAKAGVLISLLLVISLFAANTVMSVFIIFCQQQRCDLQRNFRLLLQLKVKKLEQLVRLKDSKIDSLRLQLENGVAY